MELLITLWAAAGAGMVLGAVLPGLSFARLSDTGLGLAGGVLVWAGLRAIGADAINLPTGTGSTALLAARAASGALGGAVALWIAAGLRATFLR